MKEIPTRKIGVDPGFSSLKLAEVHGSEINTVALPAAVGLGTDITTGLSLAGVTRSRTTARPLTVTFDDTQYLVGANIDRYTRPIHRMDFGRFTDSPELRAALYAALFRLTGTGEHRLALVLALPVTVLQRRNDARAVERKIRDWLVRTHHFAVDGADTRLSIVTVRATIPQPVAGWFDWGMDTAGQWVKGAAALKAPTLVIDQGFNTLDVLVVQNGQISQRYTGGDTLGMRRAAERLTALLEHHYGIQLDLTAADTLIRRLNDGKKATVFVNGDEVDVTSITRQARDTLASDVVRFLERTLAGGRSWRVLLTGGGSIGLRQKLLTLFPSAEFLPNPVRANARGLAKLARRNGFLDG